MAHPSTHLKIAGDARFSPGLILNSKNPRAFHAATKMKTHLQRLFYTQQCGGRLPALARELPTVETAETAWEIDAPTQRNQRAIG